MRVKELCAFIEARERHRRVREGVATWKTLKREPDPIIAQYRFCNVRRNDDRVTKWIQSTLFAKWRNHEHLWFALIVARLFNNEATLIDLMQSKCILPYKPLAMKAKLRLRASEGKKNFNAAYIVSTNGRAMNKIDYVVDLVLTPIWRQLKFITSRMQVGQLASVQILLEEQQGLGSFMAAQVIADLKYAHPNRWDDFYTFAASGPGSRRGLNRVMGRELNAPWREDVFRATLATLRDSVNSRLRMDPLTAQDLQNCLCEFDKYERARTGEGTPKQLYKEQIK